MVISFIFAVLSRLAFDYVLGTIPIVGGLSFIDVSYFSIIVIFRFIINSILEHMLGDMFYIHVSDFSEFKYDNILKMDNSNTNSSSDDSYRLSHREWVNLNTQFCDNLSHLSEMIKKMGELKIEKGIKYIQDEDGGLAVDAPNSMSDKEATDLSKRVGVIDRIIQTKFDEYKELEKKRSTF